jgi:serine/threonine protein kinase
MQDLIGQSLGRYRITARLGDGGMAIVYKAFDTHLECEVAVKVIRTDQILPAALERTLKRFEREAKDVARLGHLNIVRVMDYGEEDGIPYLVMPLLAGGTLRDSLLRKGRMDWKEAASLLLPIAGALEHAHKHGIIHRDVKPANILLTSNGVPMLADFGVAKVLDEEGTMDLTGTNATIGTPEYMAPEQIVSKTVDHRADIYALGVVYYEMVTGSRPFVGETPMETLFKHASEPLTRPTRLNPSLPGDVETFLIKSLMKKPVDRFSTMAEMEDALRALLRGAQLPFSITPSVPAAQDDVETYDGDLGTVDELKTTDQGVQAAPFDRIPPPAPPVYYTPPVVTAPAKNNSLPWIILGGVAVVGVIAIALLSGRGSPTGGSSYSPSNNPVYEAPVSVPTVKESNLSGQLVYEALTKAIPTITPTVFQCPGMPPSQVKVGDNVEICSKERLILRQEPSVNAPDIRRFEPGTEFELIGGPVCADDSTWWQAKFRHNNTDYIGWVREGTDAEAKYFICVVK